MSEGVNETTVSFVDSSTATTATETNTTTITTITKLETTLEPPETPPPPSSSSSSSSLPSHSPIHSPKTPHNNKNYRKFTRNNTTFYLIDGKKIRSALTHKKWPPQKRRVSFPINDNELVTGYLEPANPWEHADNVNIEDLISSYKVSCQQHGVEPLENLIAQLEKLDISDDERCPELSLKNECLDARHCEPLEELLKRVQFEKIDVESSSLDDESATILFDMLEYYQSARHLNMSSNRNIGARGWQACAQMIKRTTCLEQFEARDITLTQQHMNILKRPIQLVSHLHVLKLENCGLAGRAFVVLVSALKMNTGLKELYLADNGFEQEDAIQLGALLRINNQLQLLDISNNHIADAGVRDLLDGLIAQSGEQTNDKGLSILVLWNNDLTRSSSTYFSEAIAQSTTLETLNIGKNAIGNEFLEVAQDTLTNSRTLLQLGIQSTNITCKGALLLAGIIERNRSLQRIDLRDNNIQMEGLAALSFAIKRNPCVTQLDLDPTPWSSKPATMNQYLDLVAEIRANCARNEEPGSTDESTEESGSPQHRSRLSSVSSRKISLTCQTLPRSPSSSIAQNTISDITARTMLEPKRTSGGRLRSPAPSPIPSPVASPIPSPSRGRFVVSRVCESSLSSTNSSASSSPATPSSLGSSPTCFFPPTSVVSSRFRVTVVGPTETSDNDDDNNKHVVTPANTNITIGFNYKIQRPDNSLDSDDSDSVFRSDVEDEHREPLGANDSSPSIDISMDDEFKTTPIDDTNREWSMKNATNDDKFINETIVEDHARNVVPAIIENNQTMKSEVEPPRRAENNKSSDFSSESSNDLADETTVKIAESTNVSRSSDNPETKVNSTRRNDEDGNRDEIITRCETESKKPEVPPRQTTSLKRLLGLFQHPGSLFSPSTYVEKTEINNTLQDRVNSMIALGDKFQQYLRDGRTSMRSATDDSTSHPTLQRSVSDASRSCVKSDPVKSLSVQHLSSLETTFARDFSANEKTLETTNVPREKLSGTEVSRENNVAVEKTFVDGNERTADERVCRISENLTLPEHVQTEEIINDHISIENIVKSSMSDRREDSSVAIGDSSSSHVNERKTSVCPKLMDIEEYSILETIISDDAASRSETIDNDDNETRIREIIKCDRSSSTTDSINEPSFKISSQCKLTCDIISGDKSVRYLSETGDVHNFFTKQTKNDDTMIIEREDAAAIVSNSVLEDEEKRSSRACETIEEINREDNTFRGNVNESETRMTEITRSVDSVVAEGENTCVDGRNEVDSREENIRTDNLELETILPVEDVPLADTIEEYLPLEVTPQLSIESERLFTNNENNESQNYSYDRDTMNDGAFGIVENRGPVKTNETNEKITGNDDDLSDVRVSEFFVRESSSATLKNEFETTRTTIDSIDDENYAPVAIIEQFSSSLSDDSGYSGKLSVDETRNLDISINDVTTEISAATDTIDRIEIIRSIETSIIDNHLESSSSSSSTMMKNVNETSSNIEERVAFVRPIVDTTFESFISVESAETRLDSAEAMSSESSEDLIFKMTDIDVATIPKETSRATVTRIKVCDDDATCMIDRYYETGQTSSGGNLFIDKSRNVHRNSQDSGIEETTASSISDENCLEAIVSQPSENFQESLDSGIDSECSSVCARVDVIHDTPKEITANSDKFDNTAAIVDREIQRFANRSNIDEILVTKDINVYNDSTRIMRIDDDKSVNSIKNVVGSLQEGT